MAKKEFDVIVIGAGQSGLAVGYYLRRSALSFIMLDMEFAPGGAWQHYWESLRLFSPAQWSSLPGIFVPGGPDYYPHRNEVIEYLQRYEEKYRLPVKRPVEVMEVLKERDVFKLHTGDGDFFSRALVSTTGSFRNPWIPEIAEREGFTGEILHPSDYQRPDEYRGKRIAIVGEGNSGAQILAEVSGVAETIWITRIEPSFHPDHVDGRYLFDEATKIYREKQKGIQHPTANLSSIVMVDTVKGARDRGVFKNSKRPFSKFTKYGLEWANGHEEQVDAVIFCTGYRPHLKHLHTLLPVPENGKIKTEGTKATALDGLWLAGYGNWTGFASATLIGVGRTAKNTVDEIQDYLK